VGIFINKLISIRNHTLPAPQNFGAHVESINGLTRSIIMFQKKQERIEEKKNNNLNKQIRIAAKIISIMFVGLGPKDLNTWLIANKPRIQSQSVTLDLIF